MNDSTFDEASLDREEAIHTNLRDTVFDILDQSDLSDIGVVSATLGGLLDYLTCAMSLDEAKERINQFVRMFHGRPANAAAFIDPPTLR